MTQPTISAERIEEMLAALAGPVGAAVIRGDDLADVRRALNLVLSVLRAQAQGSEAVAAAHIRGVLDEYERNTCTHETTHRGGSIWTICDECGRKWADDEGGFVPYSNPPKIAAALAFVASTPVQAQPRGVMKWDGHPTPSEAAELLRAYARKKRLPPSDNNFEDAAGIIDTLSALATPPAPVDGGVTDEMVMRACQALDPFISLKEMRTALTAALTASHAAVAQDETP